MSTTDFEATVAEMGANEKIQTLAKDFFNEVSQFNYSYHFKWMGRPIIQFPQDIIALQEIIWDIKPDLIVETGIAHGGSIIFSASMLDMIGNGGKVVGIDIDIREHNRKAIEEHPMYKHITMLEGSSIDNGIVEQVFEMAKGKEKILVILDSNHTHEHVLEELKLYSPLVTKDSYCIVLDTVVENMPEDAFPDRPWGIGNNPMTAVEAFLKENQRFEIDTGIHDKLLITVAPNGYLKCIKD